MASGTRVVPVRTSILFIVLLAMLLLSAPTVFGGVMSDESVNSQVDDDIITVSINDKEIDIWERSFLPLQADSGEAETSVTAPGLTIEDADGDTAQSVRDDIPVFGPDSAPVELTEHPRASSDDLQEFETENGQAVIAYLDEDVSQDDFTITDGIDLLPRSVSDLEDTLDAENRSNLNDNVTFVEEEVDITEDGELEDPVDIADYIEDPFDPGAGHYAVMVSDDDVLEIEDNELRDVTDNGGTVVGVERVAVHTDELDVELDLSDDLDGVDVDLLPGDDLGVDIETETIEDDDLVHAVGVYEEGTFIGSEFRLKLNEELNEDLRLEDTTLEHEIETINGVFEADEDITIGGETLSEDRREGTFELQSVINSGLNELDIADEDRPDLEATGDRTLDASAFLTQGDDEQDVTVETLEDFADGEYQLVAVTSESSTSQAFETTEQTVTIKSTPFEVTEFEDVTIDEGDEADIDVEIENLGEEEGTQEVTLDIEDVDEVEQDVTIDGGATEEVTFEDVATDGLDDGTYDMTVETEDDAADADLTVEEGDDPDPAEFEITEFEDQSVIEGETADIDVTIENVGDEDGEQEVTLDIEDVDEVEQDVTIDGGETEEVTFEGVATDDLDTGEYDMTVETEDAEEGAVLTVEDDDEEEIELELERTTITQEQTTTATVTAIFESDDEQDVTDDAETDITSTDESIATVDNGEISGGDDSGVVTIKAEYEVDDGNSFEDNETLEVTSVPDDVDADEEREDLGISDDVGVGESERNTPVYNPDADESVYLFSGVTSVDQVRVAGNIPDDDEMTTTRLNETPPDLAAPEDEVVAASHLSVSANVQDSSGVMFKNVSTDELEDVDADADDLQVVRFSDADEEWETLDVEVAEETDDVITLETDVPAFSNFAITADVEEDDDDDDPSDDDGIPTWAVIPVGILLVLIGFLALYALRENEEEEEEEDEENTEQ